MKASRHETPAVHAVAGNSRPSGSPRRCFLRVPQAGVTVFERCGNVVDTFRHASGGDEAGMVAPMIRFFRSRPSRMGMSNNPIRAYAPQGRRPSTGQAHPTSRITALGPKMGTPPAQLCTEHASQSQRRDRPQTHLMVRGATPCEPAATPPPRRLSRPGCGGYGGVRACVL